MPNARTLAFVGCRLLSLFVVFQALQQPNLAFVLGSLRAEGPTAADVTKVAAALVIGYVLPFLFLWFAAPWLSERVAGKQDPEAAQEALTRQNLLSLGIIFVGLFILLINIPRALSLLQFHLFQGYRDFSDLAVTIVVLFLAAWCIVGSASVAAFIARLRRW